MICLLPIVPTCGAVTSVEEPARKADEVILRRLPFTLDCDFCHINGTAVTATIPHRTSLKYHDRLSLENTPGCFICHDFYRRGNLRLLSGEMVSFNESPRLCYQCHQKRYDTWFNGDHGKSSLRCSDFTCHNPHDPRLFKVGLGEGYPLIPPPDPPEPARFLGPGNNEPYYEAVLSAGRVFLSSVVLVLILTAFMVILRPKEG